MWNRLFRQSGACIGYPVMVLAVIFPFPSLGKPAASLQYFFDRNSILERAPQSPKALRFSCGSPITPMVNMSNLFTFYTTDKTQSIIDREAMGRYVKRTWATTAMIKRMGQFRDSYVLNSAPRPELAKCILRNLRAWADAGALLQGLEDNEPKGHRQGVLLILWQLYSMANVYALVAPEAAPGSDDVATILRWFQRLSDVVVAEFTPPTHPVEDTWRWLHVTANHSNWAAVSVGAVGALTQDREKLSFAMNELRNVLKMVASDGSLPPEVSRGSKGVQYQNLAMGAISLLVALADANNIRLTTAEEATLQRCARYTIELTFDPSPLEAANGRKQEPKLDALWWVEVILPHLHKSAPHLAASMDKRVASMRPMEDGFLGGNISYLYNKKLVLGDR